MKLTQRLSQKPSVSPQLVLANTLLQYSSLELEQAIAQELAKNPALELREIQRCPTCGAELMAGGCPTCEPSQTAVREAHTRQGDVYYGVEGGGVDVGSSGDWDDLIARLPSTVTLTEHLMRQARLSLDPADLMIARHVFGNLDDRGFLCRDVGELACDLGVDQEQVEAVLQAVQLLEPVGIAARDVRECLLIQLADLDQACAGSRVAERLIRDQWDALAGSSLSSLSQRVDVSVDDVRQALRFIRESLNPFPAHAWWSDGRAAPGREMGCPRPDVIIRSGDTGGYEIELPRAGFYGLRVSSSVRRAADGVATEHGSSDSRAWERWRELCGRARLFVKSVEQRWQTMQRLMRCLVECQRDFLAYGDEHLKPLTRAQVAEMMGVHESTVSRAVSGKYVELPDRQIVELERFFDDAAPIKHAIQELVDQEEGCLSDQAITERLAERGYHISRRTVAKYRNALKILPSALRQRRRELERQQ